MCSETFAQFERRFSKGRRLSAVKPFTPKCRSLEDVKGLIACGSGSAPMFEVLTFDKLIDAIFLPIIMIGS